MEKKEDAPVTEKLDENPPQSNSLWNLTSLVSALKEKVSFLVRKRFVEIDSTRSHLKFPKSTQLISRIS